MGRQNQSLLAGKQFLSTDTNNTRSDDSHVEPWFQAPKFRGKWTRICKYFLYVFTRGSVCLSHLWKTLFPNVDVTDV